MSYKKLIKKSTGYRQIVKGLQQDAKNIMRYGWQAPRYAERIWINPQQCKLFLPGDVIKQSFDVPTANASGIVINTDWPVELSYRITDSLKIKYCIDHWLNGVTWEDTGIYSLIESRIKASSKGIVDGCKTIDDIVRRYRKLDRIFEQIKSDRRFKTRKELSKKNFREFGGVVIHIGDNGELYKGGGGVHRFSMAYVLNIELPAQIGCVHISALPYLKKYRKGRYKS